MVALKSYSIKNGLPPPKYLYYRNSSTLFTFFPLKPFAFSIVKRLGVLCCLICYKSPRLTKNLHDLTNI
jgi:hypothetical protein